MSKVYPCHSQSEVVLSRFYHTSSGFFLLIFLTRCQVASCSF